MWNYDAIYRPENAFYSSKFYLKVSLVLIFQSEIGLNFIFFFGLHNRNDSTLLIVQNFYFYKTLQCNHLN